MKIMIVDDALYTRRQMIEAIIKLGHEVVEAEDGEEAVQKSKMEKPDLVFIDIVMCGMDGITAMKLMKKETKKSKFIMCSATSDRRHIMEAIMAGATDYIVKPFDEDRLEYAIDKVIQEAFV